MSELSATYAPGGWVAASGPSTWLLVDLTLDDPRLPSCWSAVSSDSPDAVLDALLDQGLGALPAFALVNVGPASTRVILRHPVEVLVTSDNEERLLSSTPGRTWVDVDLSSDFDGLLAQSGDLTSPLRLPLAQGIGSAGLLALDRSAVPASTATPTPTPEHEHEPGRVADADLAGQVANEDDEEDGGTALAESDDGHTDLPKTPQPGGYYSQLLGSTIDRDALLAQLAESDEDGSEDRATNRQQAPRVADVTSGLTAIWHPDQADSTDSVVAGLAESEIDGAKDPRPQSPEVDERPETVPADEGLISGVPWLSGQPPQAAQAPPPNYLLEAPPPASSPMPAQSDSGAEVHTVNRAALLNAMNMSAATGPTVLAVRCPAGHLTPGYSPRCRVCGSVVEDQEPVREPRPALGRLVLSTGEVVVLDRDVILGRAPETEIQDPAFRPNLVRITDSAEVSRMHVRITLDGWQPMIRDLGSSNGTTLSLTSSDTEQMRANQDYVLEPGAQVSLADVVSFRYEVTG